VDSSEAIEQTVRDRVVGLERLYDGIIGCVVTVEVPHHHHKQGNLYVVRIDLTVPDGEIVVGRDHQDRRSHEDVHVAIRDAFAAAARQLEDFARRRRQRVKRHDAPIFARVDRIFPGDGYGFLELADGDGLYFHENSVKGEGFSALDVGDRVKVAVAEDEVGRQASAVSLVAKRRGVRVAGR
jgi:cold shock CspA family protein/ribosome-associated translation inhibitor RaiA